MHDTLPSVQAIMNFAEQRRLEQEVRNAAHDQNRQVRPERCGPCPDGHRRGPKPKQTTLRNSVAARELFRSKCS